MRNKVPAVALALWIIKIAAATVGEIGGGALSMSASFGCADITLIFPGIFVALLAAQVSARASHPLL